MQKVHKSRFWENATFWYSNLLWVDLIHFGCEEIYGLKEQKQCLSTKKAILLFSLFTILFENFDGLHAFCNWTIVPLRQNTTLWFNFVFKWACSLKEIIKWLQNQKEFFKNVTSFKSYSFLLQFLNT